MSRRRTRRLSFSSFSGALITAFLVLAVAGGLQAADQSGATTLQPDSPIERSLVGGDEPHHYQVQVEVGEMLRVVVEQRGIDVVVLVLAPDGSELAEVDSPKGNQGSETVEIVAEQSGWYQLVVRSFAGDSQAGGYAISIDEHLSPAEYTAQLAALRAQREAVVGWVSQHAIRLRGPSAGQGFADMQPLKELIGDAHIVALGEATHGTREFFQLKHRMLEMLVNEMGFTVFGIEATMPEAFAINEYVLHGRGDAAKALAGLYFWTWDTEEVLGMIEWMRSYNANPEHARKLKFYGFDMQSPAMALKVAAAYLERVDPGAATSLVTSLSMLADPFLNQDFPWLERQEKERLAAAAGALVEVFDGHRSEYISRTSEQEWAIARQHALLVTQYIRDKLDPRERFRDEAMAENARWILEHEGPGTRMVTWAHNGHVWGDRQGKSGSMGTHLRRWYGDDMVVFGFTFNQGSFQAREPWPSMGVRSFSVAPGPESQLDGLLAAADLDVAALDLHALPDQGPVAAWFEEPQTFRNIGSIFFPERPTVAKATVDVRKGFDVLFFVENTSRARPNPGVLRPPLQRLSAPVNLGFEDGEPGQVPAGWTTPFGYDKFGLFTETVVAGAHEGERCAVIRRQPGEHYGEVYGELRQSLEAERYRGKRLRLQAAVRTEVSGPGNQAYLFLIVNRPGLGVAPLFLEKMADRPITADTWQRYEIVAEVAEEADTISFGLALVGDGKAWIDAVTLEVMEPVRE